MVYMSRCESHLVYACAISYQGVVMAAIVNMEAEYLKRTVGSCLASGLAEVAAKRPADPIEYLALWMLKYKQNTLQRTENGVRNSAHYSGRMPIRSTFRVFSYAGVATNMSGKGARRRGGRRRCHCIGRASWARVGARGARRRRRRGSRTEGSCRGTVTSTTFNATDRRGG